MNKGIVISAQSVGLASDYLNEYAAILERQGQTTSAKLVHSIADHLTEEINLQQPQSLEEQIKAMTDIFGCGPEQEFNR